MENKNKTMSHVSNELMESCQNELINFIASSALQVAMMFECRNNVSSMSCDDRHLMKEKERLVTGVPEMLRELILKMGGLPMLLSGATEGEGLLEGYMVIPVEQSDSKDKIL